jgi:putative selenate reductase molybdopterin-binding subunit
MQVELTLNDTPLTFNAEPGERLMTALRRAGCWSVKHGCETGECGACAVLIDGQLTSTCVLLAGQAEGRRITTVESLATGQGVHPIQQAFIDSGAIQCGYCTPAMLLAASALIKRQRRPSEADVREALSGVLCRCTGYKKPVEAVLRAAAVLRGEAVAEVQGPGIPFESVFGHGRHGDGDGGFATPGQGGSSTQTQPVIAFPVTLSSPQTQTDVVGHPEPKVDAVKLAKGRPVFTDDVSLPGMLYAAMLTSPHAHARVRSIDATRARALPGVHAVLTYRDIPRVIYASGASLTRTRRRGTR